MKIGFIIPLMDEFDIEKAYKNIEKACTDCKVEFDVIFSLNAKLNAMFTKIRNTFVENKRVKGFMVDRSINEHKLITIAMEKCENYDATIIYSAKEENNLDVIKAFITSWQAGNKIVYLKKVYRGFKRVTESIKRLIYKIGIKIIGVFKDINAETDIQLLDQDVVKTINQLPSKNRQLRIQDALLYYTTDIIHLEVDPKAKPNPLYSEKEKNVYRNGVAAYVNLGVSLVSIIVSILGLCLPWGFMFYVHIILWVAFGMCGLMFFVFYARKTLASRVGKFVEPSEYVAIKDKIEYYNM